MERLKESAVVLWDFGLGIQFRTLQLASSGQLVIWLLICSLGNNRN